jgi:formate hydrogenlyase transcriptional activator
VILSDGEVFSVDESWLRREVRQARPPVRLAASIADREREIIEAALAESQGRVSGPSGAAAKLGIPRQTLDSKIATLQISKLKFKSPRV